MDDRSGQTKLECMFAGLDQGSVFFAFAHGCGLLPRHAPEEIDQPLRFRRLHAIVFARTTPHGVQRKSTQEAAPGFGARVGSVKEVEC